MGQDRFSPEKLFEQIKPLSNAANQPLVDLSAPEEVQVHIRPDDKVPLAKFIPDPLLPGGWKAHPLTIRAMRKDIFMVGEGFEDLEQHYVCHCGQELDLQFWLFCPYCEASIKIS